LDVKYLNPILLEYLLRALNTIVTELQLLPCIFLLKRVSLPAKNSSLGSCASEAANNFSAKMFLQHSNYTFIIKMETALVLPSYRHFYTLFCLYLGNSPDWIEESTHSKHCNPSSYYVFQHSSPQFVVSQNLSSLQFHFNWGLIKKVWIMFLTNWCKLLNRTNPQYKPVPPPLSLHF